MSASLGSKDIDWNFRIFAQRSVYVKAKNLDLRKVTANDLITNTSMAMTVPQDFPIESVEIEKEYLASLSVYTLKSSKGIDEGYTEFFEVLDVDQSVEDFIKVYGLYPNHVKFVLTQLESE